VRNAFAHSLFPENRKEHRKNKEVLYGDKDIRTHRGLKSFLVDYHLAFNYLERRFGEQDAGGAKRRPDRPLYLARVPSARSPAARGRDGRVRKKLAAGVVLRSGG